MEKTTKRQAPQKPPFWKSPAGLMTGIALGVGVVGAAAAAFAKKTAPGGGGTTPPPAPVQGVQRGSTNSQGQTAYSNFQAGYYYMSILASSDPTAALSSAGFGQIQAQPDPFNQGVWLVTAYWTAPGGATALMDGGPGSWEINEGAGLPTLLSSTPPVPQQVTGLVVNDWYTFSVRTEFLQTASLNGESAAGVLATLLTNAGWSGVMVTPAADTSSSPDTWNVAAQWYSSTLSQTQDAPPVWVLLGAPVNVGPTQPAAPGNTMP